MAAPSAKRIDQLMETASQALVETKYFTAESQALKALGYARHADDFRRMARIVLPLQEARRHRVQQALETNTITIIDAPVTERTPVEPGCYLIRPPQVGADARRLRMLALENKVPIAVVCREPLTQLKLCPIVAIAPGTTIRAMIDPPEDLDDIDMAWFVDAMEALGDAAIERVDVGRAIIKQVDQLLGSLDAIPDHERLHQALEEACQRADREQAEQKAAAEAKATAGSRRTS